MAHPEECRTPEASALGKARRRLTQGGIAAMVLLGLLATAVVWQQRANKAAADARHAARMHPSENEPGMTLADFAFPADAAPTRVRLGLYVERVLNVSIKETRWTVEFYVWFRWTGDSKLFDDGFRIVGGTVESSELEARSTQGHDHYRRYRVVANITKSFDLSRFPCDDHWLTIEVEHPTRPRAELLFVAHRDDNNVSSRVRVSAYRITEWAIVEKPHTYKSTLGDPIHSGRENATHSQGRLGLHLERAGWGYYFKMFQALYVAIAIAMVAMFIRPTNVDPRFGLGVGGLFAAVANTYVTSGLIPDTGVMTLADVVNGLGIGSILLTVVQSTLSLSIYERPGMERLSRRFDRIAFGVLASLLVAVNLLLPIAASW